MKDNNQTAYGWGLNAYSTLAQPESIQIVYSPIMVTPGIEVRSVALGSGHGLLLDSKFTSFFFRFHFFFQILNFLSFLEIVGQFGQLAGTDMGFFILFLKFFTLKTNFSHFFFSQLGFFLFFWN